MVCADTAAESAVSHLLGWDDEVWGCDDSRENTSRSFDCRPTCGEPDALVASNDALVSLLLLGQQHTSSAHAHWFACNHHG